jgi:pyridoxine 5-phosphate synthase
MIQALSTQNRSTPVLSVNLNKVALLRNSRGGRLPDPLGAARVAIAAGCHAASRCIRARICGTRARTTRMRCAMLCTAVELNLEGNPFADADCMLPGIHATARRPAARNRRRWSRMAMRS